MDATPIDTPDQDISGIAESWESPFFDDGLSPGIEDRADYYNQFPSFDSAGPFPGAPMPRRRPGEPPPPVPPPDALAFYLPFHYFHPRWWGIYLFLEGTQDLARILIRLSNGRLTWHDAFAAARLFLYGHEAFHHATEAFATRLEVTHRRALYKGPFQRLYNETVGTDDCMEEALANAYAYRKVRAQAFKKPNKPEVRAIALNALAEYIRLSGPGYRRGVEFLDDDLYEKSRAEFAEENHAVSFPTVPRKDWGLWLSFPHAFSGVSRVTSRVNYIVHRSAPLTTRLPLHLRQARPGVPG